MQLPALHLYVFYRRKIKELLIKNNYSTKELSKKLNISIGLTRRILNDLKFQNEIEWFARWYGKNAGYCRVWRILESEEK
uniref:Uncharacterized protein n=1 Tax=viral metagenome TaxID=1070528 RepID=A0A6M3LHV2_9ZZZZ